MQTALVTGASSGIGEATAVELARNGYHVVAAGRSEERTMEVVRSIDRDGGSAEYLHLDLASLESAKKTAHDFVTSGRTLDALINNAGVGFAWGRTHDGFEIHFGVNHLGHFMLTHHLRPALRSGARVVVVSSEAHRSAKGIDFDKVRKRTGPRVLRAYAVSKLANILFAGHLAALAPELNTCSLHPGMVNTKIFPSVVKPFVGNLISPEESAQRLLWCATSDEIAKHSGLYYTDRRTREPSPPAQDDSLAADLWRRSEEWCGITA